MYFSLVLREREEKNPKYFAPKFVPKKRNKNAKNSGRGNSNSNDYDGEDDQADDEANNKRGGRRRGDRRKDHSGKGPSQITFTLFVRSGVWVVWLSCISRRSSYPSHRAEFLLHDK